MQVTFLGTGTSLGVPIIGCDCEVCNSSDPRDARLRSSVFLQLEKLKILIDIGPDFRQQMLANQLDDIDFILLTHEHNDHVAGLDDIRAINFLKKKNIPVYGLERTLASIKKRFDYIFANKSYPGIPQIELHPILPGENIINDLTIEAIPVMHGKMPVLAFGIKDFMYITDANFIDAKHFPKLKNYNIVVLNALRKSEHYSHFSLDQAISFLEMLEPKQAYLTHMSHQLGLHEQLTLELPQNILPAYDQLSFEIK